MSRYYDPVTHRFINADGYFQSGGDILDANTFAYCRNNPIMFSDVNGECGTHNSYYVPTCAACNPDLVKYQQKHIGWLNRVYGRNDIEAVNDKGEFIYKSSNSFSSAASTTSSIATFTRGSTLTAAGYYAESASAAAGISIASYAVTTPLNIAAHASNNYLNDCQKGIAIGQELLFAGIGIAGAVLFCSCPIAGVIFAAGWTMLSYGFMSGEVSYWENQNKQNLGYYQ